MTLINYVSWILPANWLKQCMKKKDMFTSLQGHPGRLWLRCADNKIQVYIERMTKIRRPIDDHHYNPAIDW